MAFRTETETMDLVRDLTKMVAHIDVFAQGNFTTDINDITDELAVGDFVQENSEIQTQLDRVIASMGNLWREGQRLMTVSYPAIGRLASSPDLTDNRNNADFFQQFAVDTANNIELRGFVKDTATTITGAGAGLITISSTDINGSVIDVGHVEDVTFRCVKDFSEGATAGREQFEPRGESLSDYPWLEGGSDLGQSYNYPYGKVSADFGSAQARTRTGSIITSISGSVASGNLIRNADFETAINGTTVDKLTQWLFNAGETAVTQESTDPINGELSIDAAGNFQMDQSLSNNRLQPRSFYFISVKLDRQSSGDGTLTVKIMDEDEGSTHGTLTQVVASLTNDIPVPIQPVIFQVPETAEDLKVQVELAGWTTGSVKIDDVVIAPAVLLGGYLYAIMDGTTQDTSKNAQGRYKNGDEFVVQTTSTDAGLIQKFYFNMPFSRYIEADVAASANWQDPTL